MGAATASGSPRGRPRRSVLVVEKDEELRENVLDVLSSEPALVLAAADATEAFRFLTMEEINLLLTDYEVPGSNGIELIEAARNKYPNVSAVLVTADFHAYERLDQQRKGGIKFLPKPFDAEDLLRIVREELRL